MRRKVGLDLQEDLLGRAVAQARREGRRLDELVEAALESYLAQHRLGVSGSIVSATAGTFGVTNEQLAATLEEDLHEGD